MDHLELHGARIPRLGFGTWQITGDACTESVRDALDIGYRHLDTARAYGNEREVGEGLRTSGVPREEVWITTKVWYEDLEPARVRASAEASLRDLGIDHVDLLLIHWPSPEGLPLDRTLAAMTELVEEGRASHIGVSNFPPGHLRRALELAPILTDQVEFHPFLGQDELLDIAREHDTSVTAYAPLAHGKVPRDETLREIARSRDATPAQVALRWLLDIDRTLVVPKAASHENRVSNFEAQHLELTADERDRVDALPKDRRDFSPAFAPDWDD